MSSYRMHLRALISAIAILCTSLPAHATIFTTGMISYVRSGGQITVKVPYIENNGPTYTTSGNLALQVWATSAQYSGGYLTGYKLVESSLGQLQGGYYWRNIQYTQYLAEPPAGNYNIVVVLAELQGYAYVTDDYANTTPRQDFGLLPPSPLSPGSIVQSGSYPLFDWTSVANADSYRLIVHKDGVLISTDYPTASSLQPLVAWTTVGSYTWWVQAWSSYYGYGPWSSAAYFTVTPLLPGQVTPIGPSGSITTRYPQFSWTAASYATKYYVVINRNGSLYDSGWLGNQTSYTPSTAFPVGNYEWWIRGWNSDGYGSWSAGKSFSIEAQLPATPAGIAPTGTTTSKRPAFSWSAAQNAAWYYLSIKKDGSTYTQLWSQATTWAPIGDMPKGNYQWWVRGWNSDGYGPWSSETTFSIVVNLPATPTGLSPVGTLTTNRPAFSWNTAQYATWYNLSIKKDGTAYTQLWSQATSWKPPADMAKGSYQWWIRGWNADGYGSWSDTASFSLPGIKASTQISPSGTASGSSIGYSWQGDPFATWYQLWINKGSTKWTSVLCQAGYGQAGTFTRTIPGHTDGSTYSWYVRGWNSVDKYGPWSAGMTFQIVVNADADSDRLPDAWEATYGLNPSSTAGVNGAQGDLDGDGMSNLAEYKANTSPADRNSRLDITRVTAGTGGVSIAWQGGVTATQFIERCSDIRNPVWITVYTNIPPTTFNELSDKKTFPPCGFYRIRIP